MLAPQKQLWEEAITLPGKQPGTAPRSGRDIKLRMLFLGGLLLAFTFGLLRTYLGAEIEAKGYEIDKLKKEVATLEINRDRLEMDVARLASPARIGSIAEKDLQMRQPAAENYLLLPEESYRLALANLSGGRKEVQEKSGKPSFLDAAGSSEFLRTVNEALERMLGLGSRVEASELFPVLGRRLP